MANRVGGTRYCPSCGQRVRADATICPRCDASLVEEPPSLPAARDGRGTWLALGLALGVAIMALLGCALFGGMHIYDFVDARVGEPEPTRVYRMVTRPAVTATLSGTVAVSPTATVSATAAATAALESKMWPGRREREPIGGGEAPSPEPSASPTPEPTATEEATATPEPPATPEPSPTPESTPTPTATLPVTVTTTATASEGITLTLSPPEMLGTLAGDETSETAPAPPGIGVAMDGLILVLGDVLRPAADALVEADPANEATGEGNELIMVAASLTCTLEEDDACPVDLTALRLLGGDDTAWEPRTGVQGVAGLLTEGAIEGGSTRTGWLIYEIPQERETLVLAYEHVDGEVGYLALPEPAGIGE